MARRKNAREGNMLPDYEGWEFQLDPATDKILMVALNSSRETWNLGNPDNFDSYQRNSLFAFQFGAYGDTRVLIWEQADHIDSALEAAGEWLSDHAPGHLSDLEDEYKEALKEAKEELGEDADEEEIQTKAQEIAETDMTYTESGWLNSSEWHVDELTPRGGGRDHLFKAALYASKALHAASNNTYYLYAKLPVGLGESDSAALDEQDMLALFADEGLGLTGEDVKKISELDEDQSVDLKAFRIERIG